MIAVDDLRRQALTRMVPPQRVDLASWMEAELKLPASIAAIPGRIRLRKWQRGVCDAISDPAIRYIGVQKSARVGFTTVLLGALGSCVANDPAPTILALPVLDDCKNFVRDFWEPVSDSSPALQGVLTDAHEGRRNNMLAYRFVGGSLHILPAKAPRNLRAKPARNVFIDEVDAFETSKEGDPISMAERRTEGFADKKILIGGTPIHAETSTVLRVYEHGDGRIFECAPPCGCSPVEIRWEHIKWEKDGKTHRPETAAFECPTCKRRFDDRHKSAMIEAGDWRVTRPDIRGFASFRINSLISLAPDMTWPDIAADFLRKKRQPDTLKTFVNLTLGEPWRENLGEILDDAALAARAESSLSLDAIPAECLWITAGVDVGRDRLDCTLMGHTADDDLLILHHESFYGDTLKNNVWPRLEALLKLTWPHPLGGRIGVSHAAIDAGDGVTMDAVLDYTQFKWPTRIAIKGDDGFKRQIWKESKTDRGRLFIVGVDPVKDKLGSRLKEKKGIRFSASLPENYWEELCGEHRKTTFSVGKEIHKWLPVTGRRHEAWDCAVYAWAVRRHIHQDAQRRENELRCISTPAAPAVQRIKYLSGER